jgi:hypothetical protein
MPEYRTNRHPISPVLEWKWMPMRKQSDTGIRRPSPVTKCSRTGINGCQIGNVMCQLSFLLSKVSFLKPLDCCTHFVLSGLRKRFSVHIVKNPTDSSLSTRVTDPDQDSIGSVDPDLESGSKRAKMTHKSRKKFESSCIEVLDGLFWELKASSVITRTFFMEA